MKISVIHFVTLSAMLLFGSVGLAQDKSSQLEIGHPAPSIDIEHWLKGEKVSKLEEGKVYVIEFWATWCAPCIVSMPHISELQKKYGDQVTFIAISDEPLPVVERWMKQKGKDGVVNANRAEYRLTTDPDESVKNDYFIAAGQTGIPCAFIVGKTGLVEWLGHPMTIDPVLEKVLQGEWDRLAFKEAYEQDKKEIRLWDQAMAKAEPFMQAKEYDKVLAVFDEAIEQIPNRKVFIQIMKFSLAASNGLLDENSGDLAREVFETVRLGTAVDLNQLAWIIATANRPKASDAALLDVAMDAARLAVEKTESQHANIIDTLARVYFEQGNLDEAIAWQKKAVALSPEEKEYANVLKNYESQQGKLNDSK